MITSAVILAGGLGKRLEKISGGLPKPLVSVSGKAVIRWQIEKAKAQGVVRFLILTGHKGDIVRSALGNGDELGVSIEFANESEPLGTAGALLEAFPRLPEEFFVFYGDTIFEVDLNRFFEFHKLKNASVSLFVHPNSHPHDSDIVIVDSMNRVLGFRNYPHPPGSIFPNLVNAAMYVMKKEAMRGFCGLKGDLCKDLFPVMVNTGIGLYAYMCREYIKDMGTPERLAQVEIDVTTGQLEARSMQNMAPAIFFDRDGTLTESISYVHTPDQLKLIECASAALKMSRDSGFVNILVTNQPVVARGEVSFEELKNIHNKLEWDLGLNGAYLDRLFFCPHHPDSGFVGEISALKIRCSCRKPEAGMLFAARDELNLDLSSSWMIGDSTADFVAASRAGVKSIGVRTGEACNDGKYPAAPDFEFYDVLDAVGFITKQFPKMSDIVERLVPQLANSRIIGVAGLARTGKSTFAKVLEFGLLKAGRKPLLLSLDGWLLPEKARQPGVLGRHNIQGFIDFIKLVEALPQGARISIPKYLRKDRRIMEAAFEREVGDCLIIEGIISLAEPTIRDLLDVSIAVECDERIRRQRFFREYQMRGLNEGGVTELYHRRVFDENQLVSESLSFASHKVEVGS